MAYYIYKSVHNIVRLLWCRWSTVRQRTRD